MCSYTRFIWSDHYCCCYWFALSCWKCLRSDSVQLSGQQKDFLLRAQRSPVIGWEYFTARWMARAWPACGRVHSTRGEGGLGWYLRFLRKKKHIFCHKVIISNTCRYILILNCSSVNISTENERISAIETRTPPVSRAAGWLIVIGRSAWSSLVIDTVSIIWYWSVSRVYYTLGESDWASPSSCCRKKMLRVRTAVWQSWRG